MKKHIDIISIDSIIRFIPVERQIARNKYAKKNVYITNMHIPVQQNNKTSTFKMNT